MMLTLFEIEIEIGIDIGIDTDIDIYIYIEIMYSVCKGLSISFLAVILA